MMARTPKTPKKKAPLQVEALTHTEAKRRNIPTAEHESVVEQETEAAKRVRYPRNTDLDPQLVWRGKDEQDASELVVSAPPLYIQEKIHPKALIDDLIRQSKNTAEQKSGDQIDLFADFNGVPEGAEKTDFYQHEQNWSNRMILYDQGILEIQPEFQRDVVWPAASQTRFVDSLVKQLPIPSMCFAQDPRKQKWIVIDGLQRISTIVRFLRGGDWILSDLEDIDSELAGKSVASIKERKSPDHHYFTRVENLTIPVTVLRCEFERPKHMEYLFTIFHRLNTGGMKLNNQEIRNCIYGGTFNSFLKTLDLWPAWRKLNRMKPGSNYRLTKQELILRVLAFHAGLENYKGHLAKFLNDFMHANRNASEEFLTSKRKVFEAAVGAATSGVFDGKPPSRISTTVLEALLVGLARNHEALPMAAELPRRFQQLISDPDFADDALIEGLSKRQRVIDRLNKAVSIFKK